MLRGATRLFVHAFIRNVVRIAAHETTERKMISIWKLAFINAVILFYFTSSASAQNYHLHPSYGTVNLVAGFSPDPHSRVVRAGGDTLYWTDACRAYFAEAPDYRLNYRAGSVALSIYVRATDDTALLIRNPVGSWFCNDDLQHMDPGIHFNSPHSGQYDIWVGTSASGETHGGDEIGYLPPDRVDNSHLYISEYGLFVR